MNKKFALQFTIMLLLVITLTTCGDEATPTASITTVPTGNLTSTPPTTAAPSKTPAASTTAPVTTPVVVKTVASPTKVITPPTGDIPCINLSDATNYGKVVVDTYGCVEGVVKLVRVDPTKQDNFYSPDIAIALVLFQSFEIEVDAVIRQDKKASFDLDTLQKLQGKKIRVKGEIRSVGSGFTTQFIKGVTLDSPAQIQDLSNAP